MAAMNQETSVLRVPQEIRDIFCKEAELDHFGAPIKSPHELGIDASNYAEELTARERLLDLLPQLQTHLDKLMSYPQPSYLLNYEAITVDSVRQDFKNFGHTIDLIQYSWFFKDPKQANIYAFNPRDQPWEWCHVGNFRRESYFVCIRLFGQYKRFWGAALHEENEDAKMGAIKVANELSAEIQRIVVLLESALRDVRYQHEFRLTVYSVGKMLGRVLELPEDPIAPIVKLARLFLDKLSKHTKNTHVILWKMELKHVDFLLGFASALRKSMANLSKGRNIATPFRQFRKFKMFLDDFLASPLPGVDEALINYLADWVQLWYKQFCQAMNNLAVILYRDIDPDEYFSRRNVDHHFLYPWEP